MYVDIQMVNALSRFLSAVDKALLVPKGGEVFEGVLSGLIMNFMGPDLGKEMKLSQLLGYICTLWDFENITVKELGYITHATHQLEEVF